MDASQMSPPAIDLPFARSHWALFLDVDGTLIDLAATPEAVKAPPSLAPILAAAREGLGGALAIVSGRPIAKIDELMAPLILPCAGEHGAELRLPDGTVVQADIARAVPDDWKKRLCDVMGDWEGVLVECKRYSASVDFRQAPARQGDVRLAFETLLAENPSAFEILPAATALEIRHRALTKAAAVHRFMAYPPFAGRIPVFVGDDVTDEDGIRAATQLGGMGFRVPEAFGGKPENVRRWLGAFAVRGAVPISAPSG